MTLAKVISVQHTNGTIISEISKRAKLNWIDPYDPVSQGKQWINAWRTHWLATGKLWATELRAEGLITTAETVEKHIKWFEKNQ